MLRQTLDRGHLQRSQYLNLTLQMAPSFLESNARHRRQVKSNDKRRNENMEADLAKGSFVSPVAAVFRMAVGVQPGQERANAAVRQSNAGIGRAVIEIDRVPICCHRVAARKYHVLDISLTFVLRFGRKHPGVSADQAFFRLY